MSSGNGKISVAKKRAKNATDNCHVCRKKFTLKRSDARYCSQTCRWVAYRQRRRRDPILSCMTAGSAEVMKAIAKLYFQDGFKIADVTYGKGVFWKRMQGKYELHASDISKVPGAKKMDFRNLSYESASFDCAVLDPPFGHNSGTFYLDHAYRNGDSVTNFRPKDLIKLYESGMTECHRILKHGGLLVVKCQDDTEGTGRQVRIHISIWEHAVRKLRMADMDLLIMTQPRKPSVNRWPQLSSRKNFSVFWVFRKK